MPIAAPLRARRRISRCHQSGCRREAQNTNTNTKYTWDEVRSQGWLDTGRAKPSTCRNTCAMQRTRDTHTQAPLEQPPPPPPTHTHTHRIRRMSPDAQHSAARARSARSESSSGSHEACARQRAAATARQAPSDTHSATPRAEGPSLQALHSCGLGAAAATTAVPAGPARARAVAAARQRGLGACESSAARSHAAMSSATRAVLRARGWGRGGGGGHLETRGAARVRLLTRRESNPNRKMQSTSVKPADAAITRSRLPVVGRGVREPRDAAQRSPRGRRSGTHWLHGRVEQRQSPRPHAARQDVICTRTETTEFRGHTMI